MIAVPSAEAIAMVVSPDVARQVAKACDSKALACRGARPGNETVTSATEAVASELKACPPTALVVTLAHSWAALIRPPTFKVQGGEVDDDEVVVTSPVSAMAGRLTSGIPANVTFPIN